MDKVGIIGTGNVGGAIAQRAKNSGFEILAGARFPLSQKSLQLAAQIGEAAFTSPENVCHQADLIFITTPPEQVTHIFESFETLEGKIFVDATNAIRAKPEPFETVYHFLTDKFPQSQVVKAFNTTGFENMLDPQRLGIPIDMFVSGDFPMAKNAVIEFCQKCGFGNVYDFGGAAQVKLQEQLALCWVNLAIMQGHGRSLALNIIK